MNFLRHKNRAFFTSLLQGLVEFELHFDVWGGNGYNPVLRVSGKLVTYSHHTDIHMDTPEWPDVDKDPFNVTITPNPVKNNMTITTDYELGRMGVHILNSHGVEVRNFSMDKQATVDMSDLPAGLYFVNIVGGKVVTKKVIVE